MKAVILAGGRGTRLSEETISKPKPMVEIAGMPIIWHIMKIYSHYGINDFIICCGYRGEDIKAFFRDYASRSSDLHIDIGKADIRLLDNKAEEWRITLADTGQDTMTGGRIKCISHYLEPNENFCLTYGDGVGNVDIGSLIRFHEQHGRLVTVTAVTPPGRFGVLDIEGRIVKGFREKIASDQYRINAGFFVCSPKIIDFIAGPETVWEQEPMISIANADQMRAWYHDGFWMPMDTLRDKHALEEMWIAGEACWKVWEG